MKKERNPFKIMSFQIETLRLFIATFFLLKLFEIIFRLLDSLWQTPNPFTCTAI